MTSAIAALAIVSSYLYSGFPFDNLCAEDRSHAAYYGSWKVTNGEGQDSTAVIEPGMRSYHFCNQFLGPGNNFAFPALPEAQPEGSDWMTDEQEQLTGIYGWVSVGVLGLVGLVFIYRVLRTVQDLFFASYKVSKIFSLPFLVFLIPFTKNYHDNFDSPMETFRDNHLVKLRLFHRIYLR